ncbi:MAG: GNAT family N-acetyltransferase [Acidobacteria bacterium]|nr:GNAT family N-acetyltransferase [Acidobacteriota bacterium]
MLEFREAGLSDAQMIAALHAQSWRSAYRGILRNAYLDGDIVAERLAIWEQRLSTRQTSQLALVAFEMGRPVGFAFVIAGADPRWGALLDNVHVVAAAQGQGIGTELIHRTGSWVRDQYQGQGVFLWVFEANTPARRFYERLGATVAERAVIEPPGGGCVAEWRYVWPHVNDLCHATQARMSPL